MCSPIQSSIHQPQRCRHTCSFVFVYSCICSSKALIIIQLNEINCWFSKMDVVFSTSFSSFIHCKLLEKTYVTKMSVNQWEQHPVWIKTMWEKNYEYWLWTIYFLLFKQKKSAIRLLFYVRAHENRNAVIQLIFSIPFPKWIFSITRSTGFSFATVANIQV